MPTISANPSLRRSWAHLGSNPTSQCYGFNISSGHYSISASNNEAIIRFDTQGEGRGGVAYKAPSVQISNMIDTPLLRVEQSTDGGNSFSALNSSAYNADQPDDSIWLFQFLDEILASATGANARVLRFTQKQLAEVWVDFDFAGIECGTASNPFNTLAEGLATAEDNGIIRLNSGQSEEILTIN